MKVPIANVLARIPRKKSVNISTALQVFPFDFAYLEGSD